MKYVLVFITFLIVTTPLHSQVSSCTFVGNFESTPLEEAITNLEKWCRITIEFNAEDLQGKLITNKMEGVRLNDALDQILEGTGLGYEKKNNQLIVIAPKGALVKYIRISNELKNKPLSEIFYMWSFNHKLEITYEESEIKGIRVNGSLKNVALDEAFEKILANTPLQYEMLSEKHIKVYMPESSERFQKWDKISKDITINGVLKDENSGETLPFASLLIRGSTKGATTNLDGRFTLFNVPTDTSQIEISFIGYRSKTVQLYPTMNMDNLELTLEPGGFELNEITIAAAKKEQMIRASSGISKIGMTPEVASILPSYGEKDIFRSLQLLPGISGTNESSSGLFVRGGTPDQNLILFDGFTVYHVDHLFGFFSAFNSNAIKDVQLYKGGYEAKFGGRLSSVVEMTGKDGNSESFNMGFGASLLSVNGFVESPFADGKGSFILAGRRSFQSGFYSSLFDSFTNIGGDSDEQGNGPAFGGGRFGRFGQSQVQPNSFFYDLNAKLTYRFTPKDKLSISLYNGEDDLDNSRITDSNSGGGFGGPFGGSFGGENPDFSFVSDNIDKSNWGNLGGSIKWSRQWSDRFFSNAIVSYSNYFSERNRQNQTSVTRSDTTIIRTNGSFEENDLADLSFKLDNELRLNANNEIDFGIQLTHNDIDYSFTQNDTISLVDRADEGLTASFYIQDKMTIADKLILNAGVRANYYSPTSQTYIEPRFSMTYLLNEKFKFKAAYGVYNQFATRVVREDIQQGSRDFWVLADGEVIPTSKSIHYIAGLSFESDGYLFDVEAFYKDYSGLTEYTSRQETSGFGPDRSLVVNEQFFSGTGVSKGIEFLVQKKFGKFNGWLGYTLSTVDYNFDVFGENSFPANQDQQHEFKAVATYQVGKFDFSSTFVYGTGRPYTAPTGFYEVGLLDGNTESYFQISDKNVLRYPSYHRLDASINYNMKLGDSKGRLGLSVFNIYNRTNTWYKEYEVIENQLLETDVSLLGLTPSLFFNWTLK